MVRFVLMGRKKKKGEGECVYCGSFGKITDDHIPPKLIFPKPWPKNLICVPSCKKCNNSYSTDDEYFRMMILFRHDLEQHPAYKKLSPTIFRGLRKPGRDALRTAVVRNVRKVKVVTKSGLYMGDAHSYNVDLSRLDRVAARIATGLFFHETGNRVPDDFTTIAYSEEGFRDIGNKELDELRTTILNPLFKNPVKEVGKDIFSYRYCFASDQPMVSVWLLEFYNVVKFLCLTMPKRPTYSYFSHQKRGCPACS